MYCCDDCDTHTIWIATDGEVILTKESQFFNLKELPYNEGTPGMDIIIKSTKK